MDSHIADKRLKDLHVEEIKVKTGADARATAQYEIDPVREKALVRKLDVRVVPILCFLFMLAFLDRTNIGTQIHYMEIRDEEVYRSGTNRAVANLGNARIQGMTADLNMKGNDYNIALFIFV